MLSAGGTAWLSTNPTRGRQREGIPWWAPGRYAMTARNKVTGRARYAADVFPAGLLHGKLLRSPHPHAVIKRIDITRALALPGVKAVVTAADFPDVSADVADQGRGRVRQLRLLQPVGAGAGEGPLPGTRGGGGGGHISPDCGRGHFPSLTWSTRYCLRRWTPTRR